MSKLRLVYRCTACATSYPKWAGRARRAVRGTRWWKTSKAPKPTWPRFCRSRRALRQCRSPRSTPSSAGPRPTGIAELDRVLGGGLVPGSRHAARWRARHRQEHSAAATRSRVAGAHACTSAARRAPNRFACAPSGSGAVGANLWLLAETSLPHIVATLDSVDPHSSSSTASSRSPIQTSARRRAASCRFAAAPIGW